MSGMSGRIKALIRVVFLPSALFWMAVAWVFMYVTYAVWAKEAFASYISMLSTSLLMQIPYLLFMASGAVNLWRFAASRFRVSALSAPAWIMLPAGILVYLAGFFMSAVMADSGSKFVGLGDAVRPPWQQETYRVTRVVSGLAGEVMDMDTGGSAIFVFEPEIYLDTPYGERRVGVFPPARIGGTYYHILDFGIAPLVRLSRYGATVSEGLVILKLLPPGRVDSFNLPSLPYRVVTGMLPKREMSKGGQRASVYDPMAPAYSVVIQKGDEIVFDGDTREPVTFDGLTLEFGPPGYWVRLDAARNPGMILFYAGVIMMTMGLPLFVLAATGRMSGPLLLALRKRDI